eukprot:TRINITY_DN5789_c0_g1_i1.p1 TRINITY_DN5789_c0_g1~~TRINITY_DN5789_c0_g1_i1.p1  ORF type:complete len:153 (+),score=0.44 TRINITY_DN5789_c0_g1_i1:3-461(+)
MIGSIGAEVNERLCKEDSTVLNWVLNKFGQCRGHDITPSTVSLLPRNVPASLTQTLSQRMSGGMCGRSPSGLTSFAGTGLGILGPLIYGTSENDGLVGLRECNPPWQGKSTGHIRNFRCPYYVYVLATTIGYLCSSSTDSLVCVVCVVGVWC